jgi:Ni,Fe-hydrogenase III small subunit
VSAGGCNGCELEVNALTNVNFDIGRYGIDIVASPRHADGLVLTGPITRNMAQALQLCWDGMPEPKLVIAVGACAISGSPFEGSAPSTAASWAALCPRSTCQAARHTR